MWVGPAQAVTFTQRTLPLNEPSDPAGIVVDAAGDVFDTVNDRMVELPADGSQPLLPFGVLSYPYSVTVEPAGDVCVTDAHP